VKRSKKISKLFYMNICIFGDSIAWGAYDPEHGGWATRLRNYLEKKNRDIIVYNLSVSDDTTTDLLTQIEIEVKSREPNIIIFAIGINDAQFIHSTKSLRVSLDEFKNNLKKLHAIAKKFTDKIVFVGLTSVDESKTKPISWNNDVSYVNENIKHFDGAMKKFCEENDVKFISMDGIINIADLDDGLHPNTEGHKKIFDKIKLEIENLLQSNK